MRSGQTDRKGAERAVRLCYTAFRPAHRRAAPSARGRLSVEARHGGSGPRAMGPRGQCI